MDGINKIEGVVVTGTSNRIASLDVAQRRPGRFDPQLYIGRPDRAAREQVLAIHTHEMPLYDEAQAYLPQLAVQTSGFVGADLMALCRAAGLIALRHHAAHAPRRGDSHADEVRVTRDDRIAARRRSRASAARASLMVEPEEGFDQIAGLSPVKSQFADTIAAPMFSGEPVKDGVLLYGPSGVGKSMLSKAVAKEAGASLIVVNGPELFSKWLGESEEAVRHVFKLARELSPCVLFFDYRDANAPTRGRGTSSWSTERVVHQLVAEIDSPGANSRIALVTASNRLHLVDDAVLQPERIGMPVKMRSLDAADREQSSASVWPTLPKRSAHAPCKPSLRAPSGSVARSCARCARLSRARQTGDRARRSARSFRAGISRRCMPSAPSLLQTQRRIANVVSDVNAA